MLAAPSMEGGLCAIILLLASHCLTQREILAGDESLLASPRSTSSHLSKDAEPTAFATGAALTERLTDTVGVTMGGSPLRDGLYRLARTQRVGVLLDRRIDPGKEVHLTLHQVAIGEALHKIAEAAGVGVTQVGPLFYFGPPAAVARLRTLIAMKREELQTLPRDAALALARSRPWGWNDLASPRDLLLSLADEGRLRVENPEVIPHDLWAAVALPTLPLLERLALVAFQFDLTFVITGDGSAVQFVPLPGEIAVVRRYPGGGRAAEFAEKAASLAPDARVRVVGGDVFVKGTLEEHERVSLSRAPPRKAPRESASAGPEQTRIERIAAQNTPVGVILKNLASRFDLDLHYDYAGMSRAGRSLNALISIEAEQVSLDDLLGQIGDRAGLVLRREGRRVEIGPGELPQ